MAKFRNKTLLAKLRAWWKRVTKDFDGAGGW